MMKVLSVLDMMKVVGWVWEREKGATVLFGGKPGKGKRPRAARVKKTMDAIFFWQTTFLLLHNLAKIANSIVKNWILVF